MKTLLLIQAIYYGCTAIWPLIHIRSFLVVTGPKTDLWLVKTVGVILLAITCALFAGLYSGDGIFPVAVLAVTSAAGLAAIDLWYGLRGVISRVYLVDAVLQLFFLTAWSITLARS